MTRGWFGVATALALAVALTFLTLPIVALFVEQPPGELLDALGEEGALDALWLSLRTTAAAMVLIVGVGTPAAYFLAMRRFRGRSALITRRRLSRRSDASDPSDRSLIGSAS